MSKSARPSLPRAARQAASAVSVLLAALAGGCDGSSDAQHELFQCRSENRQLKGNLEQLGQTVAQQQEQIRTLQGLGDKRLDMLYHIVSLELEKESAGIRTGSAVADNAIRVFLRPLDRAGDPIKAAGTIRVQLFDLALSDKNQIAEYIYDVEQVGKSWISGFMTFHYRFECPLPASVAHGDITVRATFTDYLTGKQFIDQKVVKVKLPPPATATAPTQPAK